MSINFCPHCGGNLQGITGTGYKMCPDERNCDWSIVAGRREWVCTHGARMNTHPAGVWCNGGGCCR